MALLYFAELPHIADRRQARAWEHRAGRQLLCSVLACSEAQIQIQPGGKPYLPGGPHFSISHCDGLVLLAVSQLGEIGCDAEPAGRQISNPAALRRKIAEPGEENVPLLTLWVRKEAIFKAGGMGKLYFPAVEGFAVAVCCRAEEPLEPPVRKELTGL